MGSAGGLPGSGDGDATAAAGHGGGAVWLEAATIDIQGTIDVRGTTGTPTGNDSAGGGAGCGGGAEALERGHTRVSGSTAECVAGLHPALG